MPLCTLKPIDSRKDAPHHAAHQLTPLPCPSLHARFPIAPDFIWHACYFRVLLQQSSFSQRTKPRQNDLSTALQHFSNARMLLQLPRACCAQSLFFPPPHWDIANQQQNTHRSFEKKSHHHVCSTDDFIPITCSCHAKRATGEDLNPDPDNTTAKSIYFRFLHAGISPSEAGESPRSALGGQTDIKAQLHI